MDPSEKLMADTLSRYAAEAPSDEQLLSGVHLRLRRRRTGRAIGAVVLACAAVATAITATHSDLRSDPGVVARPGAADPGWRWESYKSAQVQVPESWTQQISGAAPCLTFSSSSKPVVGRSNDWLGKWGHTCEDAVLPLNRRLPYLWFNDVQAPGIKQYDGGWAEETRLVGGTKISVLTNDDALRERILDSARPITGTDYYGCTPKDPTPSGTKTTGQVTFADICEYVHGTLIAGSSLPGSRATQLAQLLTSARAGRPMDPPKGCQDPSPRTYVVILHTDSGSWTVRVTYTGCLVDYKFPADDGTTQRLVGYPVIDLIRTGVHKPNQPSDLFDPAHELSPSPR